MSIRDTGGNEFTWSRTACHLFSIYQPIIHLALDPSPEGTRKVGELKTILKLLVLQKSTKTVIPRKIIPHTLPYTDFPAWSCWHTEDPVYLLFLVLGALVLNVLIWFSASVSYFHLYLLSCYLFFLRLLFALLSCYGKTHEKTDREMKNQSHYWKNSRLVRCKPGCSPQMASWPDSCSQRPVLKGHMLKWLI